MLPFPNIPYLLGGGDVELAELRLEVGVDLEVEQGPRDRLLELVRLGVVRFHDLGAVGECLSSFQNFPSLTSWRQ